ncbi:MAG TPA: nuclear transport factor 2 family protein [Mucilaginibacter sp.]|jgi:ketosteroid isomerase-like protein|nr:nuclear transport factor 2 family protein [Mucilaginibacter sp.]
MSKTLKYYCAVLLALCMDIGADKAFAQSVGEDSRQAKEIAAAMQNSANQWNRGDLPDFMLMYDPSATMMMPGGTVGLDSIRSLYLHKYFKGDMPKQNLRYTDMKIRLLGDNYALLTGAFTLYGNGLPERSGRYSLVMVHTKTGWKILHDHSG